MTQPDPKCGACKRTIAAHAPGCSHLVCPHRTPQMWSAPEGPQGLPGSLAEDRILLRRAERHRAERHRAIDVDLAEL